MAAEAAPRLPQLWRVSPMVALAVMASPAEILAALNQAARPSQARLQHRDLFAGGRRYYLRARQNGFELRSDSARFWNRRQRSDRAAVLEGEFGQAGAVTTLRLRARLRTAHLLISLLFPLWMALLVMSAPWSPALTAIIVGALLSFALAASHFNAALQASEMIFFVRKVLQDLPTGEVAALGAASEVVIDPVQREFSAEWQRFYEDRREA